MRLQPLRGRGRCVNGSSGLPSGIHADGDQLGYFLRNEFSDDRFVSGQHENGAEMLGTWMVQNRRLRRSNFHKFGSFHDALRVLIHAFSMMSVLVRQRSTISDIVSFESMACSFSDCSRSAGSLN